MNILLSSIGRRSYLARYFQEALAGNGIVVGTNTLAETTGMLAVDVPEVVPPAKDPSFIDALLKICEKHEIKMLFSLHDWEAPYLSAAKERFIEKGIIPVIADLGMVLTCLDKWQTVRFASELGIPAPKSFINLDTALAALSEQDLSFPLIVKPRWGQGSIGIRILESERDLKSAYSLLSQDAANAEWGRFLKTSESGGILIQEFIEGREYGVDAVNDLEGNHVACFVKEKLGMRAGETDASTTADIPQLQESGRLISNAIRHPGNIDMDFIVTPSGAGYLLEVNPRFGGGYPFTHAAGVNIPAALISWGKGLSPRTDWLKMELGVTAYKDLIIVKS